ncbi:MAG: hypothetical protein IPK15_15875 [Verrucomicrobia bacterium]|nr:hypothetical protein [Verrucomicrobiota bacterium]
MNEKKQRRRKPTPRALELRSQLLMVREALLDLHKALVESERASYEQTMGQVQSANHLLKLLTDDPWFAWLHPLSLLIVSIDEALEGSDSVNIRTATALIKSTRELLVASEEGDGFSGHYYIALQRDADVIMAHSDATKLLPK